MNLTIDFICRCMPGQQVGGDAAVVRQHGSWALFAVIDGLGHGSKANDAATSAVETLENVSEDEAIEDVMHALNAGMRGTRGAAATVCMVHGDELSGCGVGNVEIRGRSARIPWVLSPGILGRSVRDFRIFRGTLEPGARIALFSDGISGRFSLSELDSLSPRQTCEALLSQHGRNNDDATVMVVDIGG